MATETSPTNSTNATNAPTAITPRNNLTFSPASLFNNLHHRVTAQLTRDNYLSWQWQMVTYLKGQNAYGFVTGTIQPPPQTIPNPNPSSDFLATIANPDFLTWLQQDQMVLSTIVSTSPKSWAIPPPVKYGMPLNVYTPLTLEPELCRFIFN
jgi:hypothetical protein